MKTKCVCLFCTQLIIDYFTTTLWYKRYNISWSMADLFLNIKEGGKRGICSEMMRCTLVFYTECVCVYIVHAYFLVSLSFPSFLLFFFFSFFLCRAKRRQKNRYINRIKWLNIRNILAASLIIHMKNGY